jgi:hypothetical protein
MCFAHRERTRPAKPNRDIAIRFQDQLLAYLPERCKRSELRCYVCTSLLHERLAPSFLLKTFVFQRTIRLTRPEVGFWGTHGCADLEGF